MDLLILYFLIQLFKHYENGEIFSIKNIRYIKDIAITILYGQLLINPLYQAMISAVLTWHNPVGERTALIMFSSTNIGLLLGAILIILVSWIMQEGHQLQKEQQYTV